jgi:tetratricopeptide (TPR) repeat protein
MVSSVCYRHPVASPALEQKPYAQHILDRGVLLSEVDATSYMADLKNTLAKDILPRWYRIHCTNLLGALLDRLGRPEEALPLMIQAAQWSPSVIALQNVGATYAALGNPEEALIWFEKALTRLRTGAGKPRERLLLLGNIAVLHAEMGDTDQGILRIQEAIDAVDPLDPYELHLLANRLAIMGIHSEAAEFFARSLALRQGFELGEESAANVLMRLRGQYENVLEQNPALRGSVAFVLAFEEELQASELEKEGEDHDRTLAMFEATRPMRERANAAVLPEVESP